VSRHVEPILNNLPNTPYLKVLGGMQGVWFVNFNEKACMPHWGDFEDKVKNVIYSLII